MNPELTGGIEQARHKKRIEFLAKLLELFLGYSDLVPKERITKDMPNYPKYMAQDSYFRGIERFLREVASSGAIDDSSALLKYADRIAEMIQHMNDSAYDSPESKSGALPENLKLPAGIKKALYDKLRQGLSPEQAISSLINETPEENRGDLFVYLFRLRPTSRIPERGKIPEDLWELRVRQVTELQDILINVAEILQGK